MLTQSDLERERYEARLKYRRDQNAMLHDAELTGEERGEKRGQERGVLMGTVNLSERILKLEPTSQESLLAMPVERLRELAARLEKQVVERG
jgi:hypothetical protein